MFISSFLAVNSVRKCGFYTKHECKVIMKKIAIVSLLYAILLFVGGFMGYLKAGSSMSLIASSLFSLGMLIAAALSWNLYRMGWVLAAALASVLLIFFLYRFSLTYSFMPAGMMIGLTSLFLGYVFYEEKRIEESPPL